LRARPAHFDEAREYADGYWKHVQGHPDTISQTATLFAQVKSTDHVLSELLQNADDTGATEAVADVTSGVFEFTHNGADFDAAQCLAICRFTGSSKRTARSIGFRGIGFRSTFSLGPRVEVLSPTIAIAFEEAKFTFPLWIEGAPATSKTHVRVPLSRPELHAALEYAFKPWTTSAASLLFFQSIRTLTLNGREVRTEVLRAGPVPRSQYIRVHADQDTDVLLIRSELESPPSEAIDELRKERSLKADDVVPSVAVELVLGLRGTQRLYTVLPTGVLIDLPFSVNAPFVQDPARQKIKDPTQSPMNTWLLQRVGRLAAESIAAWVGNHGLTPEERADAYRLLPDKRLPSEDLKGQVHALIADAFQDAAQQLPVVLLTDDSVSRAGSATSVPSEMHRVWAPERLRSIVGQTPDAPLLSSAVSDHHARLLADWQWVRRVDGVGFVRGMRNAPPARPSTSGGFRILLTWIAHNRQMFSEVSALADLPILPCEGEEILQKPAACVRAGANRQGISASAWTFILGTELRLDEDVLGPALPPSGSAPDPSWKLAADLLRELGLHEATATSRLCERKASVLVVKGDAAKADWIRLAHILAEHELAAPANMRYVVQNGRLLPRDNHVLVEEPALAGILPAALVTRQMLGYEYAAGVTGLQARKWREWALSTLSGLKHFPRFVRSYETNLQANHWDHTACRKFITQRQGADPGDKLPTVTAKWKVLDWDFDPDAKAHWLQEAQREPGVWANVVQLLLQAPAAEWQAHERAEVHRVKGYSERLVANDLTPRWILELRAKDCLFDTHLRPQAPASLLIRTPATEPLQGIHPFVLSDLDNQRTQPLLKRLGARSDDAQPDPIIERIRSLSQILNPPLTELKKWYEAMDRLFVRLLPLDREMVVRAFRDERLIRTSDDGWSQSGQVFVGKSGLHIQGARYIHPEMATLAIWLAIGVRAEANVETLIEHVKSWQSDRPLDASELSLVRGLLSRAPDRVWDETGHWLGLDNKWHRASELNSILYDDARITLARSLLTQVKAVTADGRMLSDVPMRLAHLRDITHAIEVRRTATAAIGIPVRPEWLRVLGAFLGYFLKPDEPDLQARVRSFGTRLRATELVTVQVLKTQPFLDGDPIGPEDQIHAMWEGTKLFAVSKKPAALCEYLVTAVAQHLSHEPVLRALRACYQRDPQFIRDYLEEHFRFEQAAAVILHEASHPPKATGAGTFPAPPAKPPAAAVTPASSPASPPVAQATLPKAKAQPLPIPTMTEIKIAPPIKPVEEIPVSSPPEGEPVDAHRPRTEPTVVPGTSSKSPPLPTPPDLHEPKHHGVAKATQTVTVPVLPTAAELSQFNSLSLPTPLNVPAAAIVAEPPAAGPRRATPIVTPPVQAPAAATPSTKPEPSPSTAEQHSTTSLIALYAAATGLHWSPMQSAYINDDGRKLRDVGGICRWQLETTTDSLRRLWVTECCLEANGIEMPAEVYEYMRQDPMHADVLCRSLDHQLIVIPFAHLQQLVKGGAVQQFASEYIFKKS
jgi:hypothetical protein